MLITEGQTITFEKHHADVLWAGCGGDAVPFPIILAVVTLVVVVLLTRKTAAGLFIESVGNNPTAARCGG